MSFYLVCYRIIKLIKNLVLPDFVLQIGEPFKRLTLHRVDVWYSKSSRVLPPVILRDCLASCEVMLVVACSHVSGLFPAPLRKGTGVIF